mmetsp:Transcript_741/g.1923  ORF Transcript_741/g.1923 Transcript_741/m.1923 type:complete len:571 (-) Transcript_741:532-2244(-)|eukprot:CAMPEP_0176110792 /NCGR_PEP_ID=MMETSP0120_2-20121206/55633_1 /TAXON_ID=160619 /ORGANISM="Kryptoperidinium foliaceum, Strain CCMP 1326" /LENGTH=570 /DNA_ID=CAMNT_0017444999 /DNA_START=115 /DNA_END=1827 /DNA_ORIENTATION=+
MGMSLLKGLLQKVEQQGNHTASKPDHDDDDDDRPFAKSRSVPQPVKFSKQNIPMQPPPTKRNGSLSLSSAPRKKAAASAGSTSLSCTTDDEWQRKFQRLVAYQQQYKTCFVSLEDDPQLSSWVVQQRNAYQNHKLSQLQRKQLDSIGLMKASDSTKMTSASRESQRNVLNRSRMSSLLSSNKPERAPVVLPGADRVDFDKQINLPAQKKATVAESGITAAEKKVFRPQAEASTAPSSRNYDDSTRMASSLLLKASGGTPKDTRRAAESTSAPLLSTKFCSPTTVGKIACVQHTISAQTPVRRTKSKEFGESSMLLPPEKPVEDTLSASSISSFPLVTPQRLAPSTPVRALVATKQTKDTALAKKCTKQQSPRRPPAGRETAPRSPPLTAPTKKVPKKRVSWDIPLTVSNRKKRSHHDDSQSRSFHKKKKKQRVETKHASSTRKRKPSPTSEDKNARLEIAEAKILRLEQENKRLKWKLEAQKSLLEAQSSLLSIQAGPCFNRAAYHVPHTSTSHKLESAETYQQMSIRKDGSPAACKETKGKQRDANSLLDDLNRNKKESTPRRVWEIEI